MGALRHFWMLLEGWLTQESDWWISGCFAIFLWWLLHCCLTNQDADSKPKVLPPCSQPIGAWIQVLSLQGLRAAHSEGQPSWQIRRGFPKSGKEDVYPHTLLHLGRECSQEVLGNVLSTILELLGASCHSGNGSGIRCLGKSPGDQYTDSRTDGGICLKVLVFLFRVH